MVLLYRQLQMICSIIIFLMQRDCYPYCPISIPLLLLMIISSLNFFVLWEVFYLIILVWKLCFWALTNEISLFHCFSRPRLPRLFWMVIHNRLMLFPTFVFLFVVLDLCLAPTFIFCLFVFVCCPINTYRPHSHNNLVINLINEVHWFDTT